MFALKPAPLVSIICLAHNHAPFVAQALESVLVQTYSNINLIVVDDGSTDDSKIIIDSIICRTDKKIPFIAIEKPIGNCAAFNRGLAFAKGKYIIDLSADDVLLANRVARQVHFFESLNPKYGVIFSNALLIDAQGNPLRTFYKKHRSGQALVPSGNIYKQLLAKAIICTPTMMIRKSILTALGGYDESLSYEDYDFWVRSARSYKYGFQDEILVKKRVLEHAHGRQFYRKAKNVHLYSTLKICYKAKAQNRCPAENAALAIGVSYHFRLCFYTQNFKCAQAFYTLLKNLRNPTIIEQILFFLVKRRIRVNLFYQFYQTVCHH